MKAKKVMLVTAIAATLVTGSILTASAKGADFKGGFGQGFGQPIQQSIQKMIGFGGFMGRGPNMLEAFTDPTARDLEIRLLDYRKTQIDKMVSVSKLTQDKAATEKATIDAVEKALNSTDLQTLAQKVSDDQKAISDLKTKYPKQSDLVASTEYKTLTADIKTTLETGVDKAVSLGIITSDQATQAKTQIDNMSAGVGPGMRASQAGQRGKAGQQASAGQTGKMGRSMGKEMGRMHR